MDGYILYAPVPDDKIARVMCEPGAALIVEHFPQFMP
jgi:hypothetical protein